MQVDSRRRRGVDGDGQGGLGVGKVGPSVVLLRNPKDPSHLYPRSGRMSTSR